VLSALFWHLTRGRQSKLPVRFLDPVLPNSSKGMPKSHQCMHTCTDNENQSQGRQTPVAPFDSCMEADSFHFRSFQEKQGIWKACFLFSRKRSLLFKAQRNELDLAHVRIMHLLECFSLLQHASLSNQTNEIETNLEPKLAWLVKYLLSMCLTSFATVV
jgi:hypothetical protein